MKAVVAAFNQEKALVGAFSVITNLRMELFEALARRHTPPLTRKEPPMPQVASSAGKLLIETKSAAARRTAVTEEAAPRTRAGNSSE